MFGSADVDIFQHQVVHLGTLERGEEGVPEVLNPVRHLGIGVDVSLQLAREGGSDDIASQGVDISLDDIVRRGVGVVDGVGIDLHHKQVKLSVVVDFIDVVVTDKGVGHTPGGDRGGVVTTGHDVSLHHCSFAEGHIVDFLSLHGDGRRGGSRVAPVGGIDDLQS